jgi:hypothetical protein
VNLTLDGERVDGADSAQGLEMMRDLLRRRRLVPTRLKVDGREVELELLAGLEGKETAVELDTVSLEAAVDKAYADAQAQLPLLEQALESCCDSLMLGRVKEAMLGVSDVCRGLDSFFSLMRPLEALVGVGPPDSWDRAADEMKPLLLATQDALEQKDWVLVGDQLRYEWSPYLRRCGERLPRARAEAARLACVTAGVS